MIEVLRQPEHDDSSDIPEPSIRISTRTFGRLAQFVTTELGIKMPESKVSMIQSRLLRRVRELRLASIDEYCEYFFSSPETERVHFINAVTTNKTDFFREPSHFQYLVRTALPEIQRSGNLARNGRIALWSAACSSGEEPYTLAMVLSEYTNARSPLDFRILATDVSTKVLQKARDGIYTRESITPVPPELRRKYLMVRRDQPGSVRIKPTLRQYVSFHQLNFMDEHYGVGGMFDIIFCRNVLIYFDRPTQQAVISKLCRNLSPLGYLFVSHSESLSGLDLPLISLGSSCFRKRGE